jgi:RNA polymerase sigma-70 factor (ECF subfamily)
MVPEDSAITDGELVDCFLSDQDEAAFAELVRRHGPMVLGLCRRILRDGHDAEDAFQATFFVLARKAAAITRRETVGGWLHGVACKTALKARASRYQRLKKERQAAEMPRDTPGSGADNWEQLVPVLDQELGRLPDKYRLPIILCDLEGKSRKQAAQQLNCPEGTVCGRLARARGLLARRLSRFRSGLTGGAVALALSTNAAPACVPRSRSNRRKCSQNKKLWI